MNKKIEGGDMNLALKLFLFTAVIAGCASGDKRGVAQNAAQKDLPIYQKLDEWQHHAAADAGNNYQNTVDSLLQGDIKKNVTSFMNRHLSYIQVVQSMTDDLDRWLDKQTKSKKPFDMMKERRYQLLLLAREEHDRVSDRLRFVFTKFILQENAQALTEVDAYLRARKPVMPVGVHNVASLFQEVNELLQESSLQASQRPMTEFLLADNAAYAAARKVKLPPEIYKDKADLARRLNQILLRQGAPGADNSKGRVPNAAIFEPSTGANGNLNGSSFNPGEWAVTLDDGPSRYTPQFLDHLQQGEHYTFFWLSKLIPNHSATVSRAKTMGNELASHSYSHANLSQQGSAGLTKEINDAREIFKTSIGNYPGMFRCPYGACGANGRQRIATTGMIHIMWNVDSLDWQDRNSTSIFNRVKQQMAAQKRGVILFHDIHPQSVGAVKLTLEHIRAGSKLVTVAAKIREGNPRFASR
jgi:peptidoglycan/xylan/chitin deacetylase (PgdA/CDA1 family)